MLAPVTLRGTAVVLEPLQPEHAALLAEAASDGELWTLWYTSVPRPELVEPYIERALAAQAAGNELPFVIRLERTGRLVGTTRYMHIAEEHRRLEIGSTW